MAQKITCLDFMEIKENFFFFAFIPLSLRNSGKEVPMTMVKWRNYFQKQVLKILIAHKMLIEMG